MLLDQKRDRFDLIWRFNICRTPYVFKTNMGAYIEVFSESCTSDLVAVASASAWAQVDTSG